MSGTTPPPGAPALPPYTAAAVIAPTVTTSPWHKLAIGGGIVGGIALTFIFFSGKNLPFMGRNQPQEKPIEVQMNGPINRLEKPTESATQTAFRQNVERKAQPNNDYAKAAAESGIMVYSASGNTNGAQAKPATAAKPPGDPDDLPASSQPDAFEASLKPAHVTGSRVSELSNPRWLITQGRVLPCTQQTAIDSSLPGAVTAITSEPVRGETGDVVLIPKGARVFGTVQHTVMNGLERLAVLWQNISWMLYDERDMPHMYRIETDSPASSMLGETGLDGDIDHHYLKKIGGILGLSFIQGATQYAIAKAQSNGHGNTSVNLDSFQSGSNDAAQELLRSWIAIPDVMHRNQGLACGIYVVRDLDIRGIYNLRTR